MSKTTRARFRAASVALAPAVLLAGFLYHPYLPGPLPNEAAVAEAVVADTTRWGLAHLIVGVGSGLLILAFLAIRSYLREAGEERWSTPALPFVVLGSTLFTLLPGIEFAPLAAAESGGDVQGAQAALAPWFVPILFTGALLFAVGVIGFAVAIARSRVLSPWPTRLVVGALVVVAITRFVPFSEAQFYAQGAAVLVALWPLAYMMWAAPEAGPMRQRGVVPVT